MSDKHREFVSCPLDDLEANALLFIARLRQVPESQVLRDALESYARGVLSFDEYRSFFPVSSCPKGGDS